MIIFKSAAFLPQHNTDITYGFYGRQGGVSAGIYSALNCGPGSGDDLSCVRENRRRVAQHMGAQNDDPVTLWQHHSADCLYVDSPVSEGEARPKGDALVTDQPGLMIGVLTADCGPVLLHGRKASGAPVIGAAHAGWGGALKGVLENTVTQMAQTGALAESIKACVGPCIGSASYEVSAGFEAPFLARDDEAERFFREAPRPGHLLFDLPGYIAFRLAGAGVKTVILSDVDTYAEAERCFSYRRATHQEEKSYGRQVSGILIRG